MADNLAPAPARQLAKRLGEESKIMQGDIEQLISDFTE